MSVETTDPAILALREWPEKRRGTLFLRDFDGRYCAAGWLLHVAGMEPRSRPAGLTGAEEAFLLERYGLGPADVVRLMYSSDLLGPDAVVELAQECAHVGELIRDLTNMTDMAEDEESA